jgi:hypothetical protein
MLATQTSFAIPWTFDLTLVTFGLGTVVPLVPPDATTIETLARLRR